MFADPESVNETLEQIKDLDMAKDIILCLLKLLKREKDVIDGLKTYAGLDKLMSKEIW